MSTFLARSLKWLLLLTIIVTLWWNRPWDQLPPKWHPWEPLAIEHPMTIVTQWKLAQLKDKPQQCLTVLEMAPANALDYLPLQDYTPIAGCPLTNVVRIQSSGVGFSSAFTATCPLAVSWIMFERQALQPLAQELLGSEIVHIEHYGSFACRNIYNREQGRRSQHATANAFDVAAFQLKNGGTVSVLRDWNSLDAPDKSTFLRAAHGAACKYFGTVLGPDYNQPHEDHFHFEGGGFGLCR